MTPSTLTRGRRLLAATTATALAAGVLALAPTTAHAAAPAGGSTLQWKISDQFTNHFADRTLGGGATETADGTVSFVSGATSHDASTGITEVDYKGSVTGAFVMTGTRYYEVTVANPTVEVSANGAGQITAEVSSEQFQAQGPSSPPGSTPPKRVTVTEFSAGASTWSTVGGLKTLTSTPNWAGVLPAGSPEATALGITAADRPVDGKSFHPDFLEALYPGTRAHFYFTSGSDAKAPARFTASIPAAHSASAANVSTRYGKGGAISVTAPIAGRVSVAGLGSQNAAAGQTVRFALPRNLTAGTKRYTVTFAPNAANLSASARTVTVKIAKVAASKAKVKVSKKPTSKKKGKAVVSVKGVSGGAAPTGKVRVKLTKGKKSKYVTVNLVKGKRTATLPKLAKGKWTVRAAYLGNANYTKRGYVKVGTVKVTK
ncbi:HtaA domain-containing protein [Aeromicrobium duanguangcaii]|uniref:HtaA domain-containing protein n=1 Tax=Aeromicrobium duanguangcaii TaxID=2968086 RepID=UPI0020179737|nr:HtaA domain-containing protein [Aeromicrobium duanguangcaii]MCL3838670.1 HtaA domain-containing protein [Aeromicrobium duanguangcaii]